jgi:hypothetical protein
MPFYPDVVLRRLLLRCFAEGWLSPQHMSGLFKLSLTLSSIDPQPDQFSEDSKPRAPFTPAAFDAEQHDSPANTLRPNVQQAYEDLRALGVSEPSKN